MTSGRDSFGHLSHTEAMKFGKPGINFHFADHPKKFFGATGGFITCGGDHQDKCYKLGSNESFASMMKIRAHAASIVLDNEKLWVLGGSDSRSRLSSTEYIFSDGRTGEGPPMPIALMGHAMVKINRTTSFMVGGSGYGSVRIKKSWYYSGKWIEGPDLAKEKVAIH